ncbi:MAG: DUF4175 domain-containing protein [Magnetovibrio sp.]|nr:DUF4175 domain-containing protein [Magnetovibrio sp.]
MAGGVILWERLWPRLLPALSVFGLFLAVALLDLLPMLPFWLHISALALFAAIFGYCLRGLLSGEYRADADQVRRRLEIDSAVPHRPLTALRDEPLPGNADGPQAALWRLHLERTAALVKRLRVGWPAPGMARRDPYGFRAALLLFLVIAGAAGGTDARARLERALVPQSKAVESARLSLDMWVTPPAYTGLAPIFLERKALLNLATQSAKPDAAQPMSAGPEAILIPVGSAFLAQMGKTEPGTTVRIGDREVPFKALDAADPTGSARAEGAFDAEDVGASELSVAVADRVAASWPVRVVADRKPEVEFIEPPKNLGRGLLQVSFEARDDYGVGEVGIAIRHPEGWPVRGTGGETSIAINLPAPGLGTPQVKGMSTQDLSAHPWAGLAVEVKLRAKDAADQRAQSDTLTLALPERIFNHPAARAIIDARKKLNRPGSDGVDEAVAALEQVARRPQHFFDDTVVFLALVFARSRLLHDGSDVGVASVQKLLWETALRIEDGEFSIADRDLRDVQKRLMEAMRNKADQAELDRLMDELQRALDKYMAALAEHLERQGLTDMPENPSTQMMESGDLQRMLDEMRKMSQSGAMDAARRMLSELNRMLDAIRNGARMARQPRGLTQSRRLLKGLRDLGQRQQRLLDRNFQRMQRSRPGGEGRPQPDPEAGKMAGEQEQLRRDLGRLMLQMDEMLGAIPPSLGKADRAMKGAGKALEKGDRQGAVPGQTEAVEQLRQAAEGLAEQLARRMQGSMVLTMGRPGQQMRQRGRDPFGRRPGQGAAGEVDDGGVKIPSQMELRRSREILDELRRRSGDRNRPRLELDYLERLLEQF